jgi:hypothetical protein
MILSRPANDWMRRRAAVASLSLSFRLTVQRQHGPCRPDRRDASQRRGPRRRAIQGPYGRPPFVAIDTSVAAIRILNVVIVILRHVVCGEFALAITAARLRAFPAGDFLDNGYVGAASEKTRQANITLARTAFVRAP